MDKPLFVDMREEPFEVDLLAINEQESILLITMNIGTRKESASAFIVNKGQINIKGRKGDSA